MDGADDLFISVFPIILFSEKRDFKLYSLLLLFVGRFHAFERAHKMDPTSSGRGVRQFKTYLLHRLEKV